MTVHHPEIIISRCWNNKFVAASKCWKLHLAFPFSTAVVELLGKILLHATGIQVSWFQIPLYIYIYIYWGICMGLRPTKISMFQGLQEKALDFEPGSFGFRAHIHIHIIKHVKSIYIYIYIPGTCLSSILGFEPSKTRSFPIKTGVIWVPCAYMYI